MIETNADLEVVIKLHMEKGKRGNDIWLHILEASQKKPTDIFSCVTVCDVEKCGHKCLKCYNHTSTLYECSQNDDYNKLCSTCIVLGKHSTMEHSDDVDILENHSKKV